MAFIDTNFQSFYWCGALWRASGELSVTTVGGSNPSTAAAQANKVIPALTLQFLVVEMFIQHRLMY